MVKKLVTTAIGAGMILATVAPAFAANICNNQTTGPSSWNICERTLNKFKTLNLTNNGSVTHNISARFNTGNNTSDNNTSGGSVTTGNASGGVVKQASLNTGMITADQSDPATDDQGLNDTTGPSSNNTVNMTTNKTITLTLSNNGTVQQDVFFRVNTGNNTANGNTVGGTVMTGDASGEVSVISIMNDFVINSIQ